MSFFVVTTSFAKDDVTTKGFWVAKNGLYFDSLSLSIDQNSMNGTIGFMSPNPMAAPVNTKEPFLAKENT